MNDFLTDLDHSLLVAINSLAGSSAAADGVVDLLANSYLSKGVPIMMLIWGLWFAPERLRPAAREKLASVVVVAVAAVGIGRGLACLLPFRTRPMHTAGLEYNLPIGMPPIRLDGWTSMPSDHAILYFAIAIGLAFVSRRAGIVALIHAMVVISLPRIYLGLHYPSDMLAGALIGGVLSFLLVPRLASALEQRGTVKRLESYAYAFYPLMFFVTFQIATMFDPVRMAIPTVRSIAGLLVR